MAVEEMPEVVIELKEGLPERELLHWLDYSFRGSDGFRRMQAFYMVELAERGLFEVWGYSSAAHYAATRFGIQMRTARELIAVGRELRVLPLIDQAFLEGRINWSQTRLLTRVCEEETQQAWLQRAAEVSIRELEREVAGSEKGREPRMDGRGLPRVCLRVTADVDVVTHELWEAARHKFQDECLETPDERDFVRMLCEMYLSTRAGGTIPGRKVVDDALYHLVFEAAPDPKRTLLWTEDGPVATDEATAIAAATATRGSD